MTISHQDYLEIHEVIALQACYAQLEVQLLSIKEVFTDHQTSNDILVAVQKELVDLHALGKTVVDRISPEEGM